LPDNNVVDFNAIVAVQLTDELRQHQEAIGVREE